MAMIVYAIFEDAEAAELATAELTRNTPEHPSFGVQIHARGPLDGDDMPESATEIGRNIFIAIVAGGAVGLALGTVVGASLDIVGLNTAIGAGFGLLTGILSGVLGGMMAGTRTPKARLREAAGGLGEGERLVTVEVEGSKQAEVAEAILDGESLLEFGRC